MKFQTESLRWRNLHRGAGWLLVALIGAALIGYLPGLGVNEYTARWAGALFKVASVVYGGYRVSRDVLRIDPSFVQHDARAFAVMHLARAALIGALAVAVCVAV